MPFVILARRCRRARRYCAQASFRSSSWHTGVNKFFSYGQDVFRYIWGDKGDLNHFGRYEKHDPMCELFPTEVSCYINIGATTGAIDRSNYLCILNNNIFNQKYFLVLWMWWMFLIGLSVVGLVYRFARMMIPDLSR